MKKSQLVQNLTGKKHLTRAIGNEPWRQIVVTLP